jgi:hypothetical protein
MLKEASDSKGGLQMASDLFKAKARALARSGHFYGLPPLEFELSFEKGFREAREWLALASTREELEQLCQESRANRKAA